MAKAAYKAPNALEFEDNRFAYAETRFVKIGITEERCLVVVYTPREKTRFISVRKANPVSGDVTTMKTEAKKGNRWAKFDATTDEEAHRIALADPHNPPITDEDIASGKLKPKRRPQVKKILKELQLSEQEFAVLFRFSLNEVRDWEQGRSAPNETISAYLQVISRYPKWVRKALEE